jgi:hypothetical protein
MGTLQQQQQQQRRPSTTTRRRSTLSTPSADGSAGAGASLAFVCDTADGQWGGGRAGEREQPPPPETHPLPLLLSRLGGLQQLELISLPWLRDELLASAAALPSLTRLATLSVVAVSNPRVTHGGLLGLTLPKLRVLRWHVGDVLELMPDVGALAALRGLVALHVPTWLHTQMVRWRAYGVLDKMPLCDAHVELPA